MRFVSFCFARFWILVVAGYVIKKKEVGNETRRFDLCGVNWV